MNIVALQLSQTIALKHLTTPLYFMASKMQASSTQKTKDSAGRRLGYSPIYLELRCLEIRKYTPMTSSPGREASSGSQARTSSWDSTKPSTPKSKESSSSGFPTKGKSPTTSSMSFPKSCQTASTLPLPLISTTPNCSPREQQKTTLKLWQWTSTM